MSIELPKDIRREATESIIRYFREQRDEEIGVIAASGLLDFFLAEIAPSIYNRTADEMITRLQRHITELNLDFHEAEFQYWQNQGRNR